MASKKDLVMDLQTSYTNAVSARGKTAILMSEITSADEIAKLKFSIVDGNLLITNSDGSKGLRLSDYGNITSIKFDYKVEGRTSSYQYVDIIKNNLVDNTANTVKTYKKTSITGVTDYNDYIDASQSGYVSKSKNKGLTINAKKGSDIVIGTQYNDTITGGLGKNTLIYNSDTFGIDTVKLTKGETLDIKFQGVLEGCDINCSVANNKKDLVVTSSKADGTENKIILKNYYAKDLGATVRIDGYNLANQALMPQYTAKNYFEAGKTVKKSYTGSALADNIDASGLSKATNLKKGTGLTINGGAGFDIIVGSDYNDTIKGGAGDDTIEGGEGKDNLYGVSGNNTFVFSAGDGTDTFYSGKGSDILHFYGINLKDINFDVSGKNLIISYGNNDKLTLKNYFGKGNKVISSAKKIKTKDGEYDLEAARNKQVVIPSTDETDVVKESVTSDLAIEQGKNYTINSVSNGVKLSFVAEDVTKLSVTQSGNDIVIVNGEDTITLKGQAAKSGSVILADSHNATESVYTGTGDITGSNGNDIIFNSAGNATLTGNVGANTYIFKAGDGVDHIVSTSGQDVIKFSDVNIADIKSSVEDNKLVLRYSDNDKIYIDDFFKTRTDVQVVTADKKTFSLVNGPGFILADGNISGTTKTDIIAGGNGNDTITAGKGDDRIIEFNGTNTYVFNKEDGRDYIYAKGTDSYNDILKFNESVMSDLKLYKTTSGDLIINYNGGTSDATNNVVVVKDYYNTDSTEKNKVTKFMLKDDNNVYSIEKDYINYITVKTSTEVHGFNQYVGTKYNDEFLTNTSGTEIYSGKEGKNIYNFSKGNGIDYIFSESGKDTIVFSDVNTADLTVEKDKDNAKTVAIYYNSGNKNDRIVLQNYLDNPLSIKIKGTNNSETNVQTLVSSQLNEVITLNSQSCAANSYIYAQINSEVAQWADAGVNNGIADIVNPADTSENIDLVAVFSNN